MVSVTEHFTDFINATIAMPEHPGTQSLNPTSLKDMKLADPAAGIALMAPPTANSRGTANLRYPIDVPPGRHGLQPDVGITYDSDRQNGWLGVGWDLEMSSIQIDTRFGVPKYDGTETYLLDGEMLAPAPTNPPGAPSGPTYFQRRSEGRFDWIARSGTVASGFTWLVTTKEGIKYSYGSTSAARLADPQAANKTFRWFLDRVTNPLQNQMAITYQSDSGPPPSGNTEPFIQIYPSQIDYTSHPTLAAAYHVVFTRGGPDGGTSCNRPDTIIDGRAGFQVLTRCVLTQIDVKFQTQLVRRYTLVYDSPLNEGVSGKVFERGHFGKSLLARVEVRGTNGTDLFNTHNFDYFTTPETAPGSGPGTIAALGTPVAFGALHNLDESPRNQDGLTRTNANILSTGTEGDIGFGHATAGLGASFCLSAKDEASWRMLPFKGDGVTDGLASGGVLVSGGLVGPLDFQSRLTPGGFTGSYHADPLLTAISPLSHTDRDLFSVNHHLLVVSTNIDLTNRARETLALLDMDGDGFPDQVAATPNGMLVSRNDGFAGFLPAQQWANYTLSSNTCDDPLHHALSSGASALLTALGKLKAVLSGVVLVTGDIAPTPGATGAVAGLIIKNGETIWQHTITAADPPCAPGPGNSCSGGLTFGVQAGDRIYTQLRSIDNPNQTVAWSPRFAYQSVDGVAVDPARANLREPYGPPIYTFDQAADFKFVGHSFADWTASAFGTVDVAGAISKDPTSDDLRVRVVDHFVDSPAVVISETALSALGTASTPINLTNIAVGVGDTLTFEVLSDLPIDPTRVRWQPIVRYRTYCAIDAQTGTSTCSDVTCPTGPSGLPSCSLVQSPVPGLQVNSSDLQQQAVVYFPRFDFQPGQATKTFLTPAAGPVSISSTVVKTAATPSPVIVAIQGVNALYKKQVFAPGDVGSFELDFTTPNLPPNAQLFFTVYSDSDVSNAVTWNPVVIAGPSLPVNYRSREIGTVLDPSGVGVIDAFAGGYHGWSFGEWDASVPFDETQLANGAALFTKFFPMVFQPPPVQADTGGETQELCDGFWSCAAVITGVLTIGPAAAPILTDPHVVSTAATAGGLWGLTQLGGCGGPFSWISCDALPALRLTSSTNIDTSLTIPPLSGGINVGSAASRIDLIDMNGDRYPDAVVKDGTLFNTGAAFETGKTTSMALPFGDIRQISHFNYHLGASASGTQNLTDAQGRSTGYNVSGGLGGGFSYGHSITYTDLVDINGDGLPDHVAGNVANGSVRVRLNLGRRFSNEIVWAGHQWINQQVGSVPDFLNAFGGSLDTDTVRIEDTAANNLSVGVGGGGSIGADVGGGFNGDFGLVHTMVRTLVDFVDINGDGLPDQAMKPPGSQFIHVKLNLGNGFDVEKRVPVTPWSSVGAPDGLPDGFAKFQLGAPDDSLGYSVSRGTSKTVGGSVSIPCVGIVACTFSGSLTSTSSSSNETMAFEDIDGDGKVDQVLKGDGNANVFARLNLTGKTNLLKHVTRPLGGSFDLDYERMGNRRATVAATVQDNPANQWALAQVTLNDGRSNAYIDTFEYGVVIDRADLPSAFYDRAERENYGYARVAVIHAFRTGPAVSRAATALGSSAGSRTRIFIARGCCGPNSRRTTPG
jgi:hypothetical protein